MEIKYFFKQKQFTSKECPDRISPMPEETRLELPAKGLMSPTNEDPALTNQYQEFADRLKQLIIIRSVSTETTDGQPESSPQKQLASPETNDGHNYGSRIGWAIGAIATSGGIYLETKGLRKAGTLILTFDVLLGFTPTMIKVMETADRIHDLISRRSTKTNQS